MRCVEVTARLTAKTSKDKQGGQLKSDIKKPIIALAAHPSERLGVLALYADGVVSCFACNLQTRSLLVRWSAETQPQKTVITQVKLIIKSSVLPFMPVASSRLAHQKMC